MSSPGQMPRRRARRKTSGPQGTQLFSTETLHEYARESAPASDAPASAREPVLQGVSAGLENLRFSLRSGRKTIGRGGDNDIVIDEPSVSAQHGWIIVQPGHCVIMNTLSTYGTFVNDKRIHEATLEHGDQIRLGQAQLRFLTREMQERRPRSAKAILRWLAFALMLASLVWLAFKLL